MNVPLTHQQYQRLLHALTVVCRIGYGSVQIRVVKGLPRFIEIKLEEDYSDQATSKLLDIK